MKAYKKLESIFNKHLSLDSDPSFLKVVLATVIANRLDTLPVWLMVISKASTGKSEVTSSINLCREAYPLSDLNAKSFISFAPDNKKTQKDPSLLPQINGKVLNISDASTITSIKVEERNKIFSILRSAFDGKYSCASGMGQKSFASKFGIIMCATPNFEYSKTFETSLGERFIHIRPDVSDVDSIWAKVQNSSADYSKMKDELAEATAEFMGKAQTPENVIYPKFVVNYASLLATLRSDVIRDRYTKDVDFHVFTGEYPIRVAKQLSALYTALLCLTSDMDAHSIIKRVVRDSIPYLRLLILNLIISGVNKTDDISRSTGMGHSTVRRHLEDMQLLKILFCDGKVHPKNAKPYHLNENFRDLFKILPNKK